MSRERRPPTRDEFVTVSEAAQWMRIREAEAVCLLRRCGLIGRIAGRPRVLWGMVLDAFARGDLDGEPLPGPGGAAALPRIDLGGWWVALFGAGVAGTACAVGAL